MRRRNGFRNLRSTSSRPLFDTNSFIFDGGNSDIARQLYIQHVAGKVDDRVDLTVIPAVVQRRLDPYNIVFSDLPGLVQRAVLWDSGFAVSPLNEPVQIWTLQNFTMADLAVPEKQVKTAGCTLKKCVQPNDITGYYTQTCSGTQMLSASRCVIDTFKDDGAVGFLGAMWSKGGDPGMTPLIRLRDHSWTDPISNDSFSVYAVHTVPNALDAVWNQCPVHTKYASLTVPCHRRDMITDEVKMAMSVPSGSDWVTTWLENDFVVPSGFDTSMVVAIILAVLTMLVILAFGWYCCRHRSSRSKKAASSVYKLAGDAPQYSDAWTSKTGNRSTDRSLRLTHQSSLFSSSGDFESAGSNRTLKILLGSKCLQQKRIPYENLMLQEPISKGASGEVWICAYRGKTVAVKRLIRGSRNAETVRTFAEEIELSASLVHPNVVEFIGVAWNSLDNLAMVLEYFPRGNLQNYLHKNADLLSWARDKIQMAVAIAQALQYLHGRSPAIIHRDLKCNNILLTDNLQPKLIDFGVSRGLVDITMTAGVGTPYWAAPEILEGKRYTEQADIYSFGVVLSELDTGEIPYHNAVTESGGQATSFQILQDVMAGSLRPSFSRDCPPRIRRVGLACLSLDPSDRPTTNQLIQGLEGNTVELELSS
uniref:Protein kinase domain-containing protein n=2 Tax=Hyaloperonospora arabidopsidis (strain Emoy2) TaxID=559515 RepID=M4C5R3_HYAAE